MIKKLIVTGAAAAMLLASVAPSFASNFNFGFVSNNVATGSNSGSNGTFGFGAHSSTGSATSKATVLTVANTNVGRGNNVNGAVVSNTVTTSSNTGLNTTAGGFVGSSTGGASSTAGVVTVVNTNIR